jgi:hypothetical protein
MWHGPQADREQKALFLHMLIALLRFLEVTPV